MLAKVLIVPAVAIVLTCDLAEARKGGFVSALIRGGAHAAGSASQSSGSSAGTSASVPATKTYGPDTLTLAQLERCVGVAVELDQSSDTVDARAKTVETERSALDTAQSDLTAAQARVDRRSKASVDAFNRKLDALNARIETHNVAIRAYKALEAGHNQKVASYNGDCARKYYADDMNSVKQKLGLKE